MSSESTTPPKGQRAFIRRYATILKDLPEPGHTWRGRDVPQELANLLCGLRKNAIVEHDGKVLSRGDTRWQWRTREGAYERVQEILEGNDRDPALPCGHSAIRNERGVNGITCGVCEQVFDREEVT